jgi:uncharacterized protein (TIGR04255 family)
MNWLPLNPKHAIEQVVITVAFSEVVTSKHLQSVAERMRPRASELGLSNNVEIKGFAFAIGPTPAPLPAPAPSGFAVQRQADGKVLESLEIHQSELKYMSADYLRWNDFKSRFTQVAMPLLKEINVSVDFREVKMEYFDQFTNTNPDPVISELLRSDSQYLPKFLNSERGSFHCHVGWFDKFEPTERRLLNLNVDAFDAINPPRRIVRIMTLGSDSAPQGGLPGPVLDHLEDLHGVLKNVISDTITKATADRIALHSQV